MAENHTAHSGGLQQASALQWGWSSPPLGLFSQDCLHVVLKAAPRRRQHFCSARRLAAVPVLSNVAGRGQDTALASDMYLSAGSMPAQVSGWGLWKGG